MVKVKERLRSWLKDNKGDSEDFQATLFPLMSHRSSIADMFCNSLLLPLLLTGNTHKIEGNKVPVR